VLTLPDIVEVIRGEMTTLNALRDATLARSRSLTRACAHAIRAIHRHDWAEADALLAQAREEAKAMVDAIADQPTLYHAGYTQDALKELVEAHLVAAVVRETPIPTPVDLYVTGATYLRGMSEAANTYPCRPLRDRRDLPARDERGRQRDAPLCARPGPPRRGDGRGTLPRFHGRGL